MSSTPGPNLEMPISPGEGVFEAREFIRDEQLGALLSGFGNHEGKALLLLSMQPGVFYTQGRLHNLIKSLPGANGEHLGARTNQKDYCVESLEPIGAVAKADVGDILQFAITDVGEEIGKPFAAAMIDFAVEESVSLVKLWGATPSPSGVRSPFIRLKLANVLAEDADTVSISAIAQETGLKTTEVETHLARLGKLGLVRFEKRDINKDEVTYGKGDRDFFDPERTQKNKQRTRWSEEAVRYLYENDQATLDEVVKHCAPYFDDKALTIDQKRHKLNVLLSQHAKYGYVNKLKAYEQDITYPKADLLTAEQQEFWAKLSAVLTGFKAGDAGIFEQYTQRAESIIADPLVVRKALRSLRENSAYIQSSVDKTLGELVMDTLSAHGELDVRTVQDKIADLGRQVSISGIRKVLRGYEREGQVTSSRPGKVQVFSPS